MTPNFEDFKDDFFDDIKLKWNENLGLYMIYINARVADYYAHATNLDSDAGTSVRMNQTTLKANFKSYTQIDWDKNIAAYLMYYKARALNAHLDFDNRRVDGHLRGLEDSNVTSRWTDTLTIHGYQF